MKETIRAMALTAGADVCGFAGIERFQGAPQGFSPSDLFPACQTAVVFGVAMTKGLYAVNPRIVYQHFTEIMSDAIDSLALRLARELESKFGCKAVPVPCNSPYEYWDAQRMEGRGLISMRHAALCAGLGTLGKNTMLMNRTFGNLLNIGAVLTDLPLPSDPLAESVCISNCTKCVDSCPLGAIGSSAVAQDLCRTHTYTQKTAKGYETTECNLCRTVCPLAFGLGK